MCGHLCEKFPDLLVAAYADDITIGSENPLTLQLAATELERVLSKLGLSISASKCEIWSRGTPTTVAFTSGQVVGRPFTGQAVQDSVAVAAVVTEIQKWFADTKLEVLNLSALANVIAVFLTPKIVHRSLLITDCKTLELVDRELVMALARLLGAPPQRTPGHVFFGDEACQLGITPPSRACALRRVSLWHSPLRPETLDPEWLLSTARVLGLQSGVAQTQRKLVEAPRMAPPLGWTLQSSARTHQEFVSYGDSPITGFYYTDGSVLNSAGGWSCVTRAVAVSGAIPDCPSSYYAEMIGVAAACYMAVPDTVVDIFCDNAAVVNSVTRILECTPQSFSAMASKDAAALPLTILRRLVERKKLELTIHWIRGHAGHKFNELADKFAQVGRTNGCSAFPLPLVGEKVTLFTENGRPVYANAKGLNKRSKKCGFTGGKVAFLWAHRLLNVRGFAFCKDSRPRHCDHCTTIHGADPWSVLQHCKSMESLRVELGMDGSADSCKLVEVSRVLHALKALKGT